MRLNKNLMNNWNQVRTDKTKIIFDDYADISEKYKSGMTLSEIGAEYGVSRERIRQILSLFGLSRVDGGASTKAIINCSQKTMLRKQKQEKKEQKIFAVYGCSVEFLEQMRGDGEYRKSPLQKYRRQKQNARTRGVPFSLTLHQWWDIWSSSGHWDDMGLGKGKYHMCRICDVGAYEVGNVEIKLHEENSREARLMDSVYKRPHTLKGRLGKYELNGKRHSVKELSELFKIKKSTLDARLYKGMDLLSALTTPVKDWGR